MTSLFIDNKLNEQLHDQGYATLPILEESTIRYLLETYQGETKEKLPGFHPTMFHKDPDYREKLNAAILDVLERKTANLLHPEYTLLYGNFMVKSPDEFSNIKLHQDWTYVDEREYSSYAIWIPLIDLDDTNGAFSVIPKSHRLNNIVRGPGTACPLQDFEKELIEHHGLSLHLKAGEAVVWDHRLAHYSPPNESTQERIAITAIIVPKGTPVLHYFKSANDELVSEYHVDTNFYMDYAIGLPPSLARNRYVEETKLTLSFEDFQKLLQ